MTIRPIDIRRYDVSAKRRFDEMAFRENDVAPNEEGRVSKYPLLRYDSEPSGNEHRRAYR